MANTNPARGMRDFLPIDVRKREYVIGVIKEVYESYGFEPLETPAVENIETLTGKYGEEGNQLIFKILKRGEKLDAVNSSEKDLTDLALRYDLTVPLARVVANRRNDLPKFFKRYQIQPVWRADRPARGRFREFYQCDVDAIGSSSMMVEAELCAAVSEILTRLGFDNFEIRINHRKVLTGILESAGIPKDKHEAALITLDKRDKIGEEGISKELSTLGMDTPALIRIIDFLISILVFEKSDLRQELDAMELIKESYEEFKVTNKSREFKLNRMPALDSEGLIKRRKSLNDTVIQRIAGFIAGHYGGADGLRQIRNILHFSNFEKSRGKIRIDPTLARGLSYYTGAIFEIKVPDLAGSLGGGGRYDGLIGMFGKEQIPACGFSLGLERILVVMEERGMFQKLVDEGKLKLDSADVLVTVWNEDSIGESLKLAAELRKENLRVLVYSEADKLGKQFKYADSIKIPFVCVLGDAELAENTVTLKNLRSGEQETVERKEAAEKIKKGA